MTAGEMRSDVFDELVALRKHIRLIQGEIAAVRHPKVQDDRIAAATQELNAIVTATEGATNSILETAEAIGDATSGLAEAAPGNQAIKEKADKIENLVGELFTGCSFQDITGQRVAKVIDTLSFVEQRISRIISSFGDTFNHVPVPDHQPSDEDAKLLNGPALAAGVSQDDIDSMFD